ncbi:hypothetical protein [Streptomyces sp. NPDC093223]|uniref:hypothetical protein n=1 Tax=Streptomyces sp. NPDC093223 TaxID=3366033 RepID=UPI0037F4E92F
MRGDEFDEITSQVCQTTRCLTDEWRILADVQFPDDDILQARRRLADISSRVESLYAQVASAKASASRSGRAREAVDRPASELIQNKLSLLDLQRAYSVLQEASELEQRLRKLGVPPYDQRPGISAAAVQEQLSQVWPLVVGLQAQLDELCVRASRACVPAHFFTWAGIARRHLEEYTAHICRLRSETLVGS